MLEIYKCGKCQKTVMIVSEGDGTLVCCGQEMEKLVEKNKEPGFEKHAPVVEEKDGGIIVKIGSIPHPMEEAHYIKWIEVITPKNLKTEALQPGEKPEAFFKGSDTHVKVRAYCNVHGLWTTK